MSTQCGCRSVDRVTQRVRTSTFVSVSERKPNVPSEQEPRCKSDNVVDLSGQLSNLSESLDEFFEELEVLTSAPTAPQLSAGSPLPNVVGGAE
jgi:hypothetical protein